MFKVWIFIATFLINATFASAQTQTSMQSENLRAWKRGTAIVLFSGLAGGVLGLSTLSFYGEPEEHTTNVTTGALVGMLVGAGFLIWESSQRRSNWTMTSQVGQPAMAYNYNF